MLLHTHFRLDSCLRLSQRWLLLGQKVFLVLEKHLFHFQNFQPFPFEFLFKFVCLLLDCLDWLESAALFLP